MISTEAKCILIYRSEDLMRQADHERQLPQGKRILIHKEPEYHHKRLKHMAVKLLRARYPVS